MSLLLNIFDHPSGWGPGDEVPDSFKAVPFAPFNKADRVGKVFDWEQQQNFQGQRGGRSQQFGASSSFAYKHEEDETSFQLVDNKPQKRAPMFGSPVGRRPFANGRGRGRGGAGMAGGWQSQGRGGAQLGRTGGRGGAQGGRFGQQSQQQMQGRKFGQQSMQGGRQQYGQSAQGNKRYWDKVVRPREPSIEIHKSWKQVHTMLLADLIKAKVDAVPEAEDLCSHGHLEQFDSALEQITTRTEKPLRKFEQRQFFTVTTSDDPVLQELTAANEGTIYATDTILGVLMSASRSVYSWDLVVSKSGQTLVWDKRPKSLVDMMTVHETGNEQGLNLDEDASLNHPTHLSAETTAINQNFTQQALLKDSERWVPDDAKESPFVSGVEAGFEAAPVLYRYRRWRMPGGHRLVARTEVNGFAQKKGSADKQMVSICALNEFDSKATGAVDFRQKLDAQRSAVLATEIKNNGFKLARWTAQALLSGADEMKIGYVTRTSARESKAHAVLGVQRYKAMDLAQQLNLEAGRMWGTLRRLSEAVLDMPDGKYLLIKEPNEAKLSFYALPESYNIDDETMPGEDEDDE